MLGSQNVQIESRRVTNLAQIVDSRKSFSQLYSKNNLTLRNTPDYNTSSPMLIDPNMNPDRFSKPKITSKRISLAQNMPSFTGGFGQNNIPDLGMNENPTQKLSKRLIGELGKPANIPSKRTMELEKNEINNVSRRFVSQKQHDDFVAHGVLKKQDYHDSNKNQEFDLEEKNFDNYAEEDSFLNDLNSPIKTHIKPTYTEKVNDDLDPGATKSFKLYKGGLKSLPSKDKHFDDDFDPDEWLDDDEKEKHDVLGVFAKKGLDIKSLIKREKKDSIREIVENTDNTKWLERVVNTRKIRNGLKDSTKENQVEILDDDKEKPKRKFVPRNPPKDYGLHLSWYGSIEKYEELCQVKEKFEEHYYFMSNPQDRRKQNI